MLSITKLNDNSDMRYFNCPACEKQLSFHVKNEPPLVCDECRALIPDIKGFSASRSVRKSYHLDSKKEFFD